MDELDRFVYQLDNHQMFVYVDNHIHRELKKRKQLIGYRNDAAGARIMCLINLIRISRKLKKEFLFYWDTNSRGTRFGRIIKGDIQMMSNDYIFDYLPNFKKNIRYYDSEKKIIKGAIIEWKILLFKGENKKNVIKQMKKIIEEIFYKNKISSKETLKCKIGINIRLGDITAFNNGLLYSKRNYYNYDFNLSKWYPENIWQEIFNKIKNKTVIGTNDYNYLEKKFNLKRNFYLLKKNHLKKENYSLKFLRDIITISKCDLVICSLKSGTGLLLGLLSKKVETPETFLKIEKIYFDFYNILYSQFKTLGSIKNTFNHLFKHLVFVLGQKIKILFISIRSIINI